ncbi:MAG: ArsA family ATPase [Myxococcaceae bacterium]
MSDGQILHLFGGKGGAGKTTLALAFAMNLAEDRPKDKILLVSQDPGLALADLCKKTLSGKPSKLVAGKGNGALFAVQFDPKLTAEPFLKKFKPALVAAAQKGAVLSDEEIGKIFDTTHPGLDELIGLLSLAESLESGEYDRVVVDMSPTAHELRLFDLVPYLKKFLQIARGLTIKKKDQVAAPAGFVDEVAQKLEKLQALLKDPARTSFHIAALAEPVPEAQTRMLFQQLREKALPVSEIIVNQVEDHTGCPMCQGRRGLQAPHVRKFQALDKTVPVNLIGKREEAPRGLDDVKKFGKAWATNKETKALEFSAAEGPPALVRAPSMPPIAAPPLPPTRLIFFVGQGGVGKSSCAAAAAVTLTEKEGPVLLISTDPAHSLSDVLQSRLTDTETQVKGTKGLYARELDTSAWFANLKKRIKEKTEKVFEPNGKNPDVAYDREVLRNLIDCAPAALDELPALSALAEALLQERFKRIVVDPSPTCDSLRILELPAIARNWLTPTVAVLTKYKAKGFSELIDELNMLLKYVKRFEDALATPTESRFVVVTRGEDLAQPRTERLVEYLKERKLAVERVLVNRVLPKTTCNKCENRRKNELNVAKNLEKKVGLPITVAPALGRHPAGLRELKAFRTSWYALSATAKTKAA